MKIKCIIFLAFLIFFAPLFCFAAMVPSADLTIIVNTVEQDDNFKFFLSSIYYQREIELQTQNLFASHETDIDAYIWLTLKQEIIPGLKIDSIFCSSNNPNNEFTYLPDGVRFYPETWSSIVCIFNNTKAISKNPVLIVPGLIGTEMKKGEEFLWMDIIRMINPLNDDSFMDPLQLNNNLFPTDEEVYYDDIVKNKTVLVGDNEIVLFDYTDSLINEFAGQGYAEDELLFTFPYDWRYGVSGVMPDGKTNVILLKEKIDEILQQTGASKVDVVAHSMGGLIVRKYAMDNSENHNIDKTVFVGVPNTGTPKSIKVLVQGDNFDVLGLNDQQIKKIAKNMPASYDLLPSQKYYAENGSFIKTVNLDVGNLIYEEKELDYQQSKSFLTEAQGLNSLALSNSENLHNNSFNNFDLRTANIDFYAINGCKSPTISKIIETSHTNIFGYETKVYDLKTGTGDGTVVLGSADSIAIDNNKLFYAIKSNHGKMMSQDGTKQQIVNLIPGSSLSTGGKIITKSELDSNYAKCQLTGSLFSFLSPVVPEILDQNGNRAGLAEDGSIENNIFGADYQIMGDRKFVFVPTDENQTYTIIFKGTDLGEFTVKNEQIVDGQSVKIEVFSNLPVTSELVGQINLETSGDSTLLLDNNGDGTIDEVLVPTTVLNPEEADDFLPPKTKVILTGKEHKDGSFISDVLVELQAEDDVSGVLETFYSLDKVNFKEYTEPFVLEKRGVYNLYYFSVDRAGNNEQINVLEIKVGVRQKQFEKCWKNGKCPKIIKFGEKIKEEIKNVRKDFVGKIKDEAKSKIAEKINDLKSKIKKK
jgi:hypothetical protein